MRVVYYIVLFFLGGSFVSCGNCIYYRVRHNMNWVTGHSVCECCGRKLHPWELVPVVSCIALRGKCPTCGYPFGYNHAVSEAIGGLYCMLTYYVYEDFVKAMSFSLCLGITFCILNYISARNRK